MKKIFTFFAAALTAISASALVPATSPATDFPNANKALAMPAEQLMQEAPVAQAPVRKAAADSYTWGAVQDFAPFGPMSVTFTYKTAQAPFYLPADAQTFTSIQHCIANEDAHVHKMILSEWGKGIFSNDGVDFYFYWDDSTNKCVVPVQYTGRTYPNSVGDIWVADVVESGYGNYSNWPCTYDPYYGVFKLNLIYYAAVGYYGYGQETLSFDFPPTVPSGDTIRCTNSYNASWGIYGAYFQIMTTRFYGDELYGSISALNKEQNPAVYTMEEIDMNYTWLSVMDFVTGKYRMLVAEDASAIISTDANSVVTGELTYLEKNTGDVYILTMIYTPGVAVPYDYDTPEDLDIEIDVLADSIKYADGVAFIPVYTPDSTQVLRLQLYTDSEDADVVIPAGVYPFGYDSIAGTAQASVGVISGTAQYSYFANLNSDGTIRNAWFMTSGTVTVNKVTVEGEPQIQIIIEATNSFGKDVHIVVNPDATPTALENTTSAVKAQKLIQNGHVVILRDGKKFNTLGAEL